MYFCSYLFRLLQFFCSNYFALYLTIILQLNTREIQCFLKRSWQEFHIFLLEQVSLWGHSIRSKHAFTLVFSTMTGLLKNNLHLVITDRWTSLSLLTDLQRLFSKTIQASRDALHELRMRKRNATPLVLTHGTIPKLYTERQRKLHTINSITFPMDSLILNKYETLIH